MARRVTVLGSMAPKSPATMAKKERAKKASSLLSAQMAANALKQQREVLKAQMKSLAKERKKAMRAAKALRAKANKTDITELMQMMVMKASVMHQEAEDKKKEAPAPAPAATLGHRPARRTHGRKSATCSMRQKISVSRNLRKRCERRRQQKLPPKSDASAAPCFFRQV